MFSEKIKKRILNDRWAMLHAIILCMFLITALLVGLGAAGVHWNDKVGPSFNSPSMAFPLGTDFLGRSVFQKALYGAKISVTVGLTGSAISVLLGGLLGVTAGYLRGRTDDLILWICNTVSSVPGILLMCSVAFVLQGTAILGVSLQGVPAMSLALGLTHWVGICRLIRSETVRQGNFEYVSAAVALGSSHTFIIRRHLLPGLMHLLIYEGFIHCVAFIRAEVMLSFLGLGPVDQPSWGVMLDDARFELSRNVWWPMASVSCLVLLFSYSVYYMGEVIRDCLGAPAQTGSAS